MLSEQQRQQLKELFERMGYKVNLMSSEDIHSLANEIVNQSTDRGKLVNAQSPKYAERIAKILEGKK